MKILYVIANLAARYGGSTTACLDIAQAMAAAGHEVKIYTTNQDGSSELDVPIGQPIFKHGVEIRYFQIQSPRFWGTSWGLANALGQAIPKSDIVHTHSLYLFHGTVTAYFCRQMQVPLVISPHGSLDPYIYKRHRLRKRIMEFIFEHRNLQNANAIHFISQEEQRLAQPYLFDTPSFVVPLGLNIEDYAKPIVNSCRLRSQYPELENKKIVLFFGRINFKKGLDILVKALALVAKQRSDVHLVIAGPDNEGYGDRVKKWLEAEKVSDRTTFTGMLQGHDKLSALYESDLFVLPSYSENFGISVIEAMICGLPVIISDQVNIWRTIETSASGKVCPCDPNVFAAQILELLAKPELCQQLAKNGERLVKEQFQWSSVAESLEKEYDTLRFTKLKKLDTKTGSEK
jgi:glycosyltransferase involved in cell wall biosynthesis